MGHVQLVGFILSGISTLGKKIKFLIGCIERLALLYHRNPTIIKFQYSRVSPGDQQLAKKPEGSGYELHGKRFDRVLVDFQVLRPFRQIIHSSLRTLGAINLTVESSLGKYFDLLVEFSFCINRMSHNYAIPHAIHMPFRKLSLFSLTGPESVYV